MPLPNIRKSVKSYPVQLPADPTRELQAATKQYVDELVGTKINRTGDTMTGPLILSGDPVAANQAATKAYVDALGHPTAADIPSDATGDVEATNVQAAIAELAEEKVSLAGDTMTGPLQLNSATPTQDLQAAPKVYVDKMGSYEYDIQPEDYTWNTELLVYEFAINHDLNRRTKVTLYDTALGDEIRGDVVYNVISTNGFVVRLKTNPAIHVLLT